MINVELDRSKRIAANVFQIHCRVRIPSVERPVQASITLTNTDVGAAPKRAKDLLLQIYSNAIKRGALEFDSIRDANDSTMVYLAVDLQKFSPIKDVSHYDLGMIGVVLPQHYDQRDLVSQAIRILQNQ